MPSSEAESGIDNTSEVSWDQEEEENNIDSQAPSMAPSSDPQAAETAEEAIVDAEEAAASALYCAKELYKELVHKRKLAEARRQYVDIRNDPPLTSELEEDLGDAMAASDFPIQVCLLLRANGKPVTRKVLGEITRRTFDCGKLEELLTQHFERACGGVDYEVLKCTVVFKHESGRGGSKYHDLEELTLQSVEEVLELIEKLRGQFRKGNMVMTFEINIKFDPKAANRAYGRDLEDSGLEDVSSSPPVATLSRTPRKTRSTHLQEQNEARVRAIQNAGDFQRQLMDCWRCEDSNCTNRHNFCFPDPQERSKHYNITSPQHESWAGAISRDEATIHCPPIKIWQYWQSQGAITRESREPTRKGAAASQREKMDRFMEISTQNLEMMMQQRMMD